ncbi:uncharacterized protein MYCGRDRAFT_104952 [Zymoseptoria tritici IPO323]|uniref:Uncharacterized protein n=1 Tax=Zymoseptoria tritici (strain CBS 115943 / IPO323) TaxID=336722 RepID=F9XDX4_ZYMTI|nr:uncharacterized protein MYCGRDRAFT_104952 [Zymoseptoria tritici IPO323]EGP86567.1 hypothetical protein MYCGRDRAFT_104952 [Zymoseptoria tritici IPO323]
MTTDVNIRHYVGNPDAKMRRARASPTSKPYSKLQKASVVRDCLVRRSASSRLLLLSVSQTTITRPTRYST